ncbi:hypothetical protein SAMN02745824_1163 [Parasphingorhabdus marina DSM 22363]|uniref:Uncharacterized protein n=1 Tax=Parasphingorhabdus marina DSM 22363 TaxID=1123272 RepID=A0A1N6CWZ1_9SPHN|nr:hypothetical protein [Parasphingorhabdus marina]SIN63007.1 hypothetical protein SAMN02745824_1163 [Parasphingorhabdus marina DSM 22363]
MSTSDQENDGRDASDMMREANVLMERALKLLDMANEDLTAAKLDDAICSLNLRENTQELPESESGEDA